MIIWRQELQKAYDKRKAIVLSINLCSAEFVQPDTEESRELQAKLKDMNNHWDKLGSSLEEWRSSLQEALMQCQVGAAHHLKILRLTQTGFMGEKLGSTVEFLLSFLIGLP